MRLRRTARAVLAAAALSVLSAAPAAHADGVQLGGDVGSVLGLTVTDDPSGLGTFPAAGASTAKLTAEVTSTGDEALLTIADGDATAGPKLGHLVAGTGAGAKVLPLPLEAAAGNAAFQSLAAPVDPLLQRWTAPISAEAVTITLRQRVTAPATGAYSKTVLITVATTAP